MTLTPDAAFKNLFLEAIRGLTSLALLATFCPCLALCKGMLHFPDISWLALQGIGEGLSSVW